MFIEFGVRNSTEPCKQYPLKTYLADVIKTDFGLPQSIVNTLSPIRTFFEKATLIHVECHRENTKPTPDRFSRHWYDLYMLYKSWVGQEALSHFEILESVIEHKNAFFYYSFVNYDDCISGKLRLIPNETYLQGLEQDYTQMINAGMFSETPPSFKDIIKTLSPLFNITLLYATRLIQHQIKIRPVFSFFPSQDHELIFSLWAQDYRSYDQVPLWQLHD